MKTTFISFLLALIFFSAHSGTPPSPLKSNRYYGMAIANYTFSTIGDNVSLELKVNYDKTWIGEVFWDKTAQNNGHVSDHFGLGFGYTLAGISTRTDFKARVFYSGDYGIGLGVRPNLRYIFADNFILQAGPDINWDKKGLSIGILIGFGIGIAF